MRRAVICKFLFRGIAISGLAFLLGCPSSNGGGNGGIVTKLKESTEPKNVVEPVTAEEAEKAKNQIELAIRAHGGDNLARMRNYLICRQTGKSNVEQQAPFATDREWQIAFPVRIYATVIVPNQTTYVWSNPSGGWWRTGASTSELPGELLEDLQTQLYIFSLFTLTPLRDPQLVLKPLPDTSVGGKPAKAIKVMQKDHPQIELDFDAQSNLLVRMFLRRKLPHVGAIEHQILLSDHKRFEGIQLPTRWVEINDGSVKMDLDGAEYRFPSEI